MAANLYSTWNQTAQMGIALAAIAMLLPFYKNRIVWCFICGLIAVGMLSAPWFASWLYGQIEASSGFSPNWFLKQAAAGPRLEIWGFVSERIFERPLLGYGVEMTRYSQFDAPLVLFKSNTVLHPHNIALQLWIEFGLLGVVLGISAITYCLLKMQRLIIRRVDLMLLGGFIIQFCAVLTGYGLWQGWLLGLSMCMWAGWTLLFRKSDAAV